MKCYKVTIGWKQEPDSYLEEILGAERTSRLNPIKTFADNGIIVSLGSDAPCTGPDPIQWIHRKEAALKPVKLRIWSSYLPTHMK